MELKGQSKADGGNMNFKKRKIIFHLHHENQCERHLI